MGHKNCIACAEEIKAAALLCKHCGTMQDSDSFPKPIDASTEDPQNNKTPKIVRKGFYKSTCNQCSAEIISEPKDVWADDAPGPKPKICTSCGAKLPRFSVKYQEDDFVGEAQNYVSDAYEAYPNASTPGVAVAAIISVWFLPLLGLILGYYARAEIVASKGAKNGYGLASGAIVVGWATLAIWIFVFVILNSK